MTWAAAAVALVVAVVTAAWSRRNNARKQPMTPERFRRALDAIAPRDSHVEHDDERDG